MYYHVHTMNEFGTYIRERREQLRREDRLFSVRQVALRIGVEPSYLSKVERSETPPPSEAKVRLLAIELGEDPDVLLALAGKVSSDLQAVIRQRPQLFATLIREMKDMPEHAVLRLVREVRDGNW
jgi:HTH-type transcriptional regulator, competence development regulator